MTVLACVVVFCTMFALIQPAITMEKECDIPEHTHTDACYTQVSLQEESSATEKTEDSGDLTCENTDPDHVHTDRCYGTWELTCGMKEHTHSEECQGKTDEEKSTKENTQSEPSKDSTSTEIEENTQKKDTQKTDTQKTDTENEDSQDKT